jgi:hypothetical protein
MVNSSNCGLSEVSTIQTSGKATIRTTVQANRL